MAEKRRKKALIITLIALLLVVVTIAVLMPDDIKRRTGNDKIAVIPITGQITISTLQGPLSFATSGSFSQGVIAQIDEAEKDPSVKAIIFDINSPGGTVVASKEISDRIASAKKPTVALIRETGTSGAYWIAAATDSIVADPLSLTGSIGVTGSYLEFEGLMDKYGVGYEQLTTGEYKDTGSPFRKLTDEERKILQAKLNNIHEYFLRDVAAKRGMSLEELRTVDSGIFYLGIEAKELGLVDHLGGKDRAIDVAKELAGIKEASVKTFEEKKTFFDLLQSIRSEGMYSFGRGFADAMYDKNLKASSEFRITA